MAIAPIIMANANAITPSAKSAVLIDAKSANVLYQKNAHQKLPMASTTKIMTAYLAIKYGNLDEYVTISENVLNLDPDS